MHKKRDGKAGVAARSGPRQSVGMLVNADDVESAYGRIAVQVRRTPVMDIADAELGCDRPVNLKLELFQHTGSFKVRGAFNNLLSRPVPATGVAAASGGNHGAAVAYAASRLGYRAQVFVPEIASPTKIAKIRAAGADIVISGARYADALDLCQARQAETGAMAVHAYATRETIAGQGTVALEWAEQTPDVDTVLIAVGGAGLISGVAAWFAGRVQVIGVEPEGAPTLHAALDAGKPVEVRIESLAGDSLGARQVGDLNLETCQRHVAEVLLVSDDAIRAAMRFLWQRVQIAAEPGGAAALAALICGAYRPRRGERVGVLLCGGNVDPKALAEIAGVQ